MEFPTTLDVLQVSSILPLLRKLTFGPLQSWACFVLRASRLAAAFQTHQSTLGLPLFFPYSDKIGLRCTALVHGADPSASTRPSSFRPAWAPCRRTALTIGSTNPQRTS